MDNEIKAALEMMETRLLQRIERTETALETRLLERIERTETTLLKEFRKWAAPIDASLRINKAYSIGFDERLASLEERMNNLEGGV